MNKALAIGIIGAGAFGLIRLLRMKNVSDSVSTRIVSPRLHKVSLQGITFRTDVSFKGTSKNPFRESFLGCKKSMALEVIRVSFWKFRVH